MDNSKDVTMVEWCAGYGGIHLGLKRAIPNLRVIAYGEIEAFACANLVAKMEAGLLEPAPIWTDIKTFPCEQFRDRVDILVAGYPCQPFSAAGKRLGTEDPRHLWPHIRRAVGIIRPRICFFENVEGHISLGLSTVISDLEELGFKVSWGIFSASEVGAPHQRKRVFIMAYRDGERGQLPDWWRVAAEQVPVSDGEERRIELANASRGQLSKQCRAFQNEKRPPQSRFECCSGLATHTACTGTDESVTGSLEEIGECRPFWPARPGEPQHEWEPPRVVGDAKWSDRTRCKQDAGEGLVARCENMGNTTSQRSQERSQGCVDSSIQTTQCGGGSEGDRQTQPSLGRDADGAAGGVGDAELYTSCDNRTDELRLLGNGVVPATAKRAFKTLIKELYND